MWNWHDTTWMWIGEAAFWGALLVAAYFFARALLDRSGRSQPPAARDGSATLAERFARGEIGEEEFRARHRALAEVSSARPGSPSEGRPAAAG